MPTSTAAKINIHTYKCPVSHLSHYSKCPGALIIFVTNSSNWWHFRSRSKASWATQPNKH